MAYDSEHNYYKYNKKKFVPITVEDVVRTASSATLLTMVRNVIYTRCCIAAAGRYFYVTIPDVRDDNGDTRRNRAQLLDFFCILSCKSIYFVENIQDKADVHASLDARGVNPAYVDCLL